MFLNDDSWHMLRSLSTIFIFLTLYLFVTNLNGDGVTNSHISCKQFHNRHGDQVYQTCQRTNVITNTFVGYFFHFCRRARLFPICLGRRDRFGVALVAMCSEPFHLNESPSLCVVSGQR